MKYCEELDTSKIYVLSSLKNNKGHSKSMTFNKRIVTSATLLSMCRLVKAQGYWVDYAENVIYLMYLESIENDFSTFLISQGIVTEDKSILKGRVFAVKYLHIENSGVYLEDTTLLIDEGMKKLYRRDVYPKMMAELKAQKSDTSKKGSAFTNIVFAEHAKGEVATKVGISNKSELKEEFKKAIRFEDTSVKDVKKQSDIECTQELSVDTDNSVRDIKTQLDTECSQKASEIVEIKSSDNFENVEQLDKADMLVNVVKQFTEKQNVINQHNIAEPKKGIEHKYVADTIKDQARPSIKPVTWVKDSGDVVYYLDDMVYWIKEKGQRYAKLLYRSGIPERTTDILRDDGTYSEKDKNKVFIVDIQLVDKSTKTKSSVFDYMKSQKGILRSKDAEREPGDAILFRVYKCLNNDDYYVDTEDYFIVTKKGPVFRNFTRKRLPVFLNHCDFDYDTSVIFYDSSCNMLTSDENYKTCLEQFIVECEKSKSKRAGMPAKAVENVKDSGFKLVEYGDCLRLRQNTCSDKEFKYFEKKFATRGYCSLGIDGKRISFIPVMRLFNTGDVYDLLLKYGIISKERVTDADKLLYTMHKDVSGNYAVSEEHGYVVNGYERVLIRIMDAIKANATEWKVNFLDE